MHWKLAEAKNRFSEVVRRALCEGPQYVDRRQDSVVVLSKVEYEKLRGKKCRSLKEFLLFKGPDLDDLDLTRDPSGMREIDL